MVDTRSGTRAVYFRECGPILAEVGPNSAKFVGRSAEVGQVWPGIGRIWADVGRLRTDCGRTWPNCVSGTSAIRGGLPVSKLGETSTQYDPRHRPTSDAFGRTPPSLASSKFGPMPAECGWNRPGSGRCWPRLPRNRPRSGTTLSECGKLRGGRIASWERYLSNVPMFDRLPFIPQCAGVAGGWCASWRQSSLPHPPMFQALFP